MIVGLVAAIRPVSFDMSKPLTVDVTCGSLHLTGRAKRNRCVNNLNTVKSPMLCIGKFAKITTQANCNMGSLKIANIYRGYYTAARRYEFYFRVAKQYFTNERSIVFCHEKIKFISSRRRVMFFLLYRQNDIDETITKITSSINSRVRLWKINHSGPGCSFYEFYEWYIFQ